VLPIKSRHRLQHVTLSPLLPLSLPPPCVCVCWHPPPSSTRLHIQNDYSFYMVNLNINSVLIQTPPTHPPLHPHLHTDGSNYLFIVRVIPLSRKIVCYGNNLRAKKKIIINTTKNKRKFNPKKSFKKNIWNDSWIWKKKIILRKWM